MRWLISPSSLYHLLLIFIFLVQSYSATMESRDCSRMKMFISCTMTHIVADTLTEKMITIRRRSIPNLSASTRYIVSKHLCVLFFFHIVSVMIRCSCSTQIQYLLSPPSNENRFAHTEGQTKQAPHNADEARRLES